MIAFATPTSTTHESSIIDGGGRPISGDRLKWEIALSLFTPGSDAWLRAVKALGELDERIRNRSNLL